tara:strand:+ start:1355 stop:1735 length:381 start_codon:yes stop_codon:yes gene_type:complete
MFASVTKPSNTEAIITKVAHGLTIPGTNKLMAIYIDNATGDLLPSDSRDANKQKIVFVTEIIDVDNIRIRTTGLLVSTAHGYSVGIYHYVSDAGDGGFLSVPGTLNDIGFLAFDVNTLILIDNREL